MSMILRRYLPIVVLAGWAFFMIADTLLLDPLLNSYATSGRSLITIVGAFSIMLSVALLSRVHVFRIMRKRTVIESSVLLISMWVTIIWGLARLAFSGVPPTAEYMVQRIFDAIVSPGDSTIYAILAFFISSAAYRAFRARSIEATILLATGIIVMLGNAPVGAMIYGGIPAISTWVMETLNKAGSRVILMSAILATISLYIRIILGYERGWQGRAD